MRRDVRLRRRSYWAGLMVRLARYYWGSSPRGQRLPIYFSITLFLSAALVFLMQPMFARMVLPLLGGTPGVWIVCMLFFQTALLAGYTCAHVLPARLGVRRHAILHLGVMLLPFLLLPMTVEATPPGGTFPVFWLLWLLTTTVGLPFFVISTSAPLLQKWFADSGHPSSKDPYFLYAASNLGSMLALLCYPLFMEPAFTLAEQGQMWTALYACLVVLAAGCACRLWSVSSRVGHFDPTVDDSPTEASPRPASRTAKSRSLVLTWVALAFIPSSLMLSVTTFLTTDVASIPLLWALPLALYLLTFTFAFARRQVFPRAMLIRWMPLIALVIVFTLLAEATEPAWVLLVVHLSGLFWIGMVCHGEVARLRPTTEHLTAFYLWLAVGGVLGGLFNGVAAPLIFSNVVEYPLALVLACLLCPAREEQPIKEGTALDLRRDAVPAVLLGAATAALVLIVQASGVEAGPASIGAMFAVPAVICYTFVDRPVRFGLGLGALLLAGGLYHGVHGGAEYRTRSFFGVHRVTIDPTGSFRMLVHGNTVHGQQSLDPSQRREPLTYYHRTGPVGQIFAALKDDPRTDRVALVGLGAGALASYAQPGQRWTFFEIDPSVVHIARDSGLFTFYRESQGDLDVILGDARLTLGQSDERFGVIVIDAFSSDAIPLHLLTREALKVYRARLTDDGVLAFNVSNRYLDLQPVLANLAADADPPMMCFGWDDRYLADSQRKEGKAASQWVMLASRREDVEKVLRGSDWRVIQLPRDERVWTDDYANLVGALKWE